MVMALRRVTNFASCFSFSAVVCKLHTLPKTTGRRHPSSSVLQIVFPGSLRSGVLRGTSEHCRACVDVRAPNLCPHTRFACCLGMVCMGSVFFALAGHRHLMRVTVASVNFLDGTKIEQQRILLAVYPLL